MGNDKRSDDLRADEGGSGDPVRPRRPRRRRDSGATGSALIDSEARTKIETAAKHVGLSVEQLVDLISDSGLLAKAPPDGISEVMSVRDLGTRLHHLSCTKSRDKRATWFRGLVPTQQKALLTVLRERGYATAVIAQDYDIDPMLVVQAHNEFSDNLGKNVINTRLSTLAGQMMLAAERAQQGAMESDDWSTFWRIHKEMVMLLQSMGVVQRAAQKVEVDTHISVGIEQKKDELERLLRVARLSERRQIEIEHSQQEAEYVEVEVEEESKETDKP